MEKGFRLEIVTPERKVVSLVVEELTAPGFEGQFGVLSGHTPYLCRTRIGELSYRYQGKKYVLAVSDGFAEVLHDRVTILVDTAEKPEEVDLQRAQGAKERAEQRMKGLTLDDREFLTAQAALQRAITRIKLKESM
jgi:F-type H+-transporting ATPase subunit epsilon